MFVVDNPTIVFCGRDMTRNFLRCEYSRRIMFCVFFFFLMIRRPPRSTQGVSSAASDVYKRQQLQVKMEILDLSGQKEKRVKNTLGEGRPPSNNALTRPYSLPWPWSSRMCPLLMATPLPKRPWGAAKMAASQWWKQEPSASLGAKTGRSSDAPFSTTTNIPCTPVSYTHLTLPTILLVQISVVAVSLKKKKKHKTQFFLNIHNVKNSQSYHVHKKLWQGCLLRT
eukprot:TRINITY_DN10436_c0_g1_i1.p2 TRINITY_DN10436_c0_g1~~TRINITY_DN10436_c0_g1_i1.p2  ORF type:complete len:225 (-),score=12.24 TRINITY_DN10436_c0_g1_i1:2-676(-)